MRYHIDTLPIHHAHPNVHKFDDHGTVMSKIPYTQHFDYHTFAVASYALAYEDNEEIFLPQINWLLDHQDDDGAYRHNFKLPYYDFRPPWIGGLSQGLAISALIEAYKKYNKKIYLDQASQAFTCLSRDIDDHGCLHIDENGYTWIEEYNIRPVPHILNGFIYALFGVYDFAQETNNTTAQTLWNDGIKTLENNLYRYRNGLWSRYNLVDRYPATIPYHTIHVKQLYALYEITKKDIFLQYATMWNKAAHNALIRWSIQVKRHAQILGTHGFRGAVKRHTTRRQWLHKS